MDSWVSSLLNEIQMFKRRLLLNIAEIRTKTQEQKDPRNQQCHIKSKIFQLLMDTSGLKTLSDSERGVAGQIGDICLGSLQAGAGIGKGQGIVLPKDDFQNLEGSRRFSNMTLTKNSPSQKSGNQPRRNSVISIEGKYWKSPESRKLSETLPPKKDTDFKEGRPDKVNTPSQKLVRSFIESGRRESTLISISGSNNGGLQTSRLSEVSRNDNSGLKRQLQYQEQSQQKMHPPQNQNDTPRRRSISRQTRKLFRRRSTSKIRISDASSTTPLRQIKKQPSMADSSKRSNTLIGGSIVMASSVLNGNGNVQPLNSELKQQQQQQQSGRVLKKIQTSNSHKKLVISRDTSPVHQHLQRMNEMIPSSPSHPILNNVIRKIPFNESSQNSIKKVSTPQKTGRVIIEGGRRSTNMYEGVIVRKSTPVKSPLISRGNIQVEENTISVGNSTSQVGSRVIVPSLPSLSRVKTAQSIRRNQLPLQVQYSQQNLEACKKNDSTVQKQLFEGVNTPRMGIQANLDGDSARNLPRSGKKSSVLQTPKFFNNPRQDTIGQQQQLKQTKKFSINIEKNSSTRHEVDENNVNIITTKIVLNSGRKTTKSRMEERAHNKRNQIDNTQEKSEEKNDNYQKSLRGPISPSQRARMESLIKNNNQQQKSSQQTQKQLQERKKISSKKNIVSQQVQVLEIDSSHHYGAISSNRSSTSKKVEGGDSEATKIGEDNIEGKNYEEKGSLSSSKKLEEFERLSYGIPSPKNQEQEDQILLQDEKYFTLGQRDHSPLQEKREIGNLPSNREINESKETTPNKSSSIDYINMEIQSLKKADNSVENSENEQPPQLLDSNAFYKRREEYEHEKKRYQQRMEKVARTDTFLDVRKPDKEDASPSPNLLSYKTGHDSSLNDQSLTTIPERKSSYQSSFEEKSPRIPKMSMSSYQTFKTNGSYNKLNTMSNQLVGLRGSASIDYQSLNKDGIQIADSDLCKYP